MGSAPQQAALWGAEAQDWAELQEPHHRPLWDSMLTALGVEAGSRMLDAGCGGGGASMLAAARGAQVAGIDAADPLIEIARARIPGGEFTVGDLEALPYGAASFDAILASLSVQYAADASRALRELRRVCRVTGRLAISTWAAPETCDQRHVMKAVRDLLPSAPPGGGPFSLSAPGKLEQLIEASGWKPLDAREVDCSFDYPDLEIFWRGQRSAGPVQAALRSVPEERVHAAITAVVAPLRSRDGSIRLNNRFRFVLAEP